MPARARGLPANFIADDERSCIFEKRAPKIPSGVIRKRLLHTLISDENGCCLPAVLQYGRLRERTAELKLGFELRTERRRNFDRGKFDLRGERAWTDTMGKSPGEGGFT